MFGIIQHLMRFTLGEELIQILLNSGILNQFFMPNF